MKKLFLISVLVCFAALNQLFAVNPIPSYNTLVTGRASFHESTSPIGRNNLTDEKRQMNVQTSTASPSYGLTRAIVVVWVYRLDKRIALGPYYVVRGQSLVIGIDDKPWGVDVSVDDPARISVWTSLEQTGN